MSLDIIVDDLLGPEIAKCLQEHVEEMRSVSPPESKHALDLDGLRVKEITFWSAWLDSTLVGCGAIKELSRTQAELKSMRVSAENRGKGIAEQILKHIIAECTSRCYKTLSLETGSMNHFIPARKLYAKYGFVPCEPFSDYKDDPNSIFMSLNLSKT
jgi:putative acetyltransferase